MSERRINGKRYCIGTAIVDGVWQYAACRARYQRITRLTEFFKNQEEAWSDLEAELDPKR